MMRKTVLMASQNIVLRSETDMRKRYSVIFKTIKKKKNAVNLIEETIHQVLKLKTEVIRLVT